MTTSPTMNMSTLFNLEGRCALITGGSRGIGRMIAEGFVQLGVRVYITARKAEECDAAAAEMSEQGSCTSIPGDISTTEGLASVVSRLREHESTLDILVNNAGAAWGAPFAEFPEDGWDKVMDLNLKALFFLTQQLAPELRAAAASGDHLAKVINVASIDGIRTNPNETYSYHASKAGVIHLTKRLAAQLAPEGVIVSAIAPGAFPSRMNKVARDHGDELQQRIPAGRIGGPEDMAGVATYLASRAGDYVVGDTIVVDGGVVASAGL
ncbi:SDR family oxidoreductase [Brevibacterium antiquum]|uniref:SDR family oxidoreductase n=1 Tax=Brevibacterium antiquum TaxID=234835 RepID=UPI001E6271FA|nr:SDR family oxidoreductase [Brevibacterium antiquum]